MMFNKNIQTLISSPFFLCDVFFYMKSFARFFLVTRFCLLYLGICFRFGLILPNSSVNSKRAYPQGICHLVGPVGGEFVRKPPSGGGVFANSSGCSYRRSFFNISPKNMAFQIVSFKYLLFYCSIIILPYTQNIQVKFKKKMTQGSPRKPIRLVNRTTFKIMLC